MREHPSTPLQPLTDAQRERRTRIERHVQTLAGEIGERHVWQPRTLRDAASYIQRELTAIGCTPALQTCTVEHEPSANIEIELTGTRRPEQIVIIGAHYDTMRGSPGANDNASGVAALLELTRELAGRAGQRTLRLVAFTNEEHPFGWSERMGSKVYANRCRQRGERIVGMIALDGLGCFSDAPRSQRYPLHLGLIYPSRGDFLAMIANLASTRLLLTTCRAFRRATDLPTQAAILPGFLPAAARSDHWSFWQHRYPAMLITDTLPFRDPHYHQPTDTPDRLDYERLTRAVDGLTACAQTLAGTHQQSPS